MKVDSARFSDIFGRVKILFVLLFLSTTICSSGQSIDYPNHVFINGSSPANFKGGEVKLLAYIMENLEFSDSAFLNDAVRKVFIEFVVDTLGNVGSIQTLGKKHGYGVEEEVMRVIESTSGLWEPALQFDKKVVQRMMLPVQVCFTEESSKDLSFLDTIYTQYDVLLPASYTGGNDSLKNKIYQNLYWPKSLGTTCGTWVVVIKFIVNTDGSLSELEVINDSPFADLNQAAKEALRSTSGGWSPAYRSDDRVRMQTSIPIVFLIWQISIFSILLHNQSDSTFLVPLTSL
jgi:TonB family protein